MRYMEKDTRPTTFCVCKRNSTTVILPVPFSNMAAIFFTTSIPIYYDIFPYSTHVLWLFYCYPFFHKHYGLDAALSPTVKPHCFSPTTIPRLAFFTLLKILLLLKVRKVSLDLSKQEKYNNQHILTSSNWVDPNRRKHCVKWNIA